MNPKPAEKKSQVIEAQDRFMKLLITQMKNQDPLSPLDNAQFTSQLAQLNTVTGIDKLNQTLEALQGNYQSTTTVQAAGMISHGVLAPGNKVAMARDKLPAVLGYELTNTVDNVKINIKNGLGHTVATLNAGKGEPGSAPLTWDGKDDEGKPLPDGIYTFEVKGMMSNGEERTYTDKEGKLQPVASPLQVGTVQSVSLDGNNVKLNTSGFSKQLTMADVRQIL
jgi:flagellar basal-body rod modification protein FlgD